MPLCMVCGTPSSGKSTLTLTLKKAFVDNGTDVAVVSEHDLPYDKNTLYSDSKIEKEQRGALRSEVQRLLTKQRVVLVDAPNYIKGFRYELFCIAKATSTPHCVVFLATNQDTCREWNRQRPDDEKYSDDILDGLWMRFEEPNDANRWDSPQFVIQVGDEPPTDDIRNALLHGKSPTPNLSTQNLQPVTSSNFLHELDRVTQQVVMEIVRGQDEVTVGEQLTITAADQPLNIVRRTTLSELRRLKRQFVNYTRSRPVTDTTNIATMFVHYLNETL